MAPVVDYITGEHWRASIAMRLITQANPRHACSAFAEQTRAAHKQKLKRLIQRPLCAGVVVSAAGSSGLFALDRVLELPTLDQSVEHLQNAVDDNL